MKDISMLWIIITLSLAVILEGVLLGLCFRKSRKAEDVKYLHSCIVDATYFRMLLTREEEKKYAELREALEFKMQLYARTVLSIKKELSSEAFQKILNDLGPVSRESTLSLESWLKSYEERQRVPT